MAGRTRARDWQQAIEPWFVRNGLPWFVESERAHARSAMQARKTLPTLLLVALLGLAGGVALAWWRDTPGSAPATLTQVVLVAVLVYFVTALRARPIVGWALRRTWHSARQLVPMVTRALPLLLLFVTFLFINAEVWQLSSWLDGSLLWLTILLFALMALVFLWVRLPEEVDRVDDEIDAGLLRRATRGTPIEEDTRRLLDSGEPIDFSRYGDVPGWERRNLILVLLVTQVAQVLLLSLSVFVFFMVFGGLVMNHHVQLAWTGAEELHALPYLTNLTVELVQVSVFLAAFSGLYFTVGVVTDETYREQFFTDVLRELERAVGVRAAYLALREHAGDPVDDAVPASRGEDDEQRQEGERPDEAERSVQAPVAPVAEPDPEPAPEPDPGELVGHWGFTQERADDISAGSVTGELAFHRDGTLLRRYGGSSFRGGRTRWDFGPWHTFTGWRREPDEAEAQAVLERRGYVLQQPGPLAVDVSRGGPYDGPPAPPQPLHPTP